MREILLLTGLVICSSACSSSGDLPFEPAGPDAAPDPMAWGPFPVGVRTVELFDDGRPDADGNPRRLLTEIWYPATPENRDGPFWEYEPEAEASEEFLGDRYPKLVDANLPGMQSRAVRDAGLYLDAAPYPLIIFSHGAYGIRWQSVFYTPHLASHGYIVISADHTGHTVWELLRDGFDEGVTIMSSNQRVGDVGFLLDTFLGMNDDPGNFLHGAIQRERMGITGHSFGAWTAVTKACTDPRLLVAVGHSPVIGLATVFGCDLDAYPVPLMAMGGTRDLTVEWRSQVCDYNVTVAAEKYLYELVDGGHYTFSDICDLDLLLLAEEFDFGTAEEALEDGCSTTENIPWKEAHQSINHYSTALFNVHLRDSPGSLPCLQDFAESPFENGNFYTGDAPEPPGGCP